LQFWLALLSQQVARKHKHVLHRSPPMNRGLGSANLAIATTWVTTWCVDTCISLPSHYPSYISRRFRMSDANSTWSSPLPSGDTPSSSINAFSSLRRSLSVSEQSLDLSHLRPNADISELPSIRLGSKKYIKEE